MNKYIVVAILSLITFSCHHDKPASHKVYDSWESGVRLNVILEGGGVATLVCPKYKGKPAGGHGIECYIQGDN